jgi:glycosyltransferase involved in cell wall biosynthesis
MKIFFDYKIFFIQKYGGPSSYFVNLVRELNIKKDINAKIFSPLHINKHLQDLDKKFFYKFFFLKKIDILKYFEFINIILTKIFEFINIILTKIYLFFFAPKIYHTTYYGRNLSINNTPMIVTVFDLIHEIYSETFYKKLDSINKKKKILENSRHIICISKNTQRDLIKYYNIKYEKTSVVYLGKHENSFLLNNINISRPFFLYVGNRHRYKNFKILLEAYSHSKNLMKNCDLICFGGELFSNEEKNFIQKNKILENNIKHLSGSDELLIELYQKAVALIYPSLYEGFGLPLVDAMHQGCPLVISDTSCFPEICGEAALYFNPLSVDELKNKMDQITFDNKIKNDLIAKGKKRANFFSWNKCANETLEVYKKIV